MFLFIITEYPYLRIIINIFFFFQFMCTSYQTLFPSPLFFCLQHNNKYFTPIPHIMLPNLIEDIVATSNITEVPQTSPPNIDVDVHIVQSNIMKALKILVELIYIKQSQIRLISPNYQLTNI